jgi:hypothetical protein
MSNSALIIELRKKAIATLHESTKLFEKAYRQLKAGKPEEAEKTQRLARSKRTDSAWLMNEASRLESESPPPSV